MSLRKKTRMIVSIALCASLIAPILPVDSKVFAAADTPTLNAYQLGDHVKLEWGVGMQASDVLSQTSYEPGQEIPNLTYVGTGNQSVVTVPGGSTGIRLTDTITNRTGNLIDYPLTNNDTSIHRYKGRSVPSGTTLSITFRALAEKGSTNTLFFNAATGWFKKGFELTDNNGKLVKYKTTVDYYSAPETISVYVDEGTVSFNEGQLAHFVSSKTENYDYGIVSYIWDATNNRFKKMQPGQQPNADTKPNGQYFTPLKETFFSGDSVLTLLETSYSFPRRDIPSDGAWHTYSLNTLISENVNYDTLIYGIIPRLFWATNGTVYLDDMKFGFATRAQIFRDGNSIPEYDGYLSDFEDIEAVDRARPNPVTNASIGVSSRYPTVNWSPASDVGTTYNYTIKSISQTAGNSALSSIVPVTVTSGIKGYSVVIDSDPWTMPDNVIETTETSFKWPSEVNRNVYAHIVAVDNQGNLSSVVHMAYTDTIPPTLNITPSTTDWTNQPIVLTGTATDNETGVERIKLPDGRWGETSVSYTAESNGVYTFVAEDNARNTKSQSYTVTNIDKTPPVQPTMTINPSGWSNDSVTVTLTPGTDGQSGVQKTRYKIGSGAWIDYSSPFTVSTAGQTLITAHTIDNVGNISSTTAARAKVDKTVPTVPTLTMSDTSWTNQNVTFTITDGADSESGTEKSQYKINSGAWIDYNAQVTLSTEGVTDVYARTLDNVGNASASVQGTARIDKTPPSDPSITLSESTWTKNPVTFTIGGSSDVNVITYEYKLNDGTYTDGSSGMVSQEGATTVTVRAKDAVGNRGNDITKTIYVDHVAPTLTVTPDGQGWSSVDIPVTIAFEDAHSGIDANQRFYKVTASPTAPTSWDAATSNNQTVTIQQEGVWYVHAKGTDVAGNHFQTVSQPIQLQREAGIPGNVRVTQVTEQTANVTFDLPTGIYTDGYQYDVTNETTGQTWNLAHPDHAITDTSLESGKAYDYTVTARNHVGQSASSAPVTALTLPKAPENVTIEAVGMAFGQASVTFDPVESATAYRIVAKDESTNIVYNQTVTDTVNQPIGNLASGSRYTISISAINASGEGASSNKGYLSLPSAPGNFRTVQIGVYDIALSWDAVTSATYYHLTRNDEQLYGGDPTTSYHDLGLESGTLYNYELYTENETGRGESSLLTDIITLPEAVTNLQVSDPTTTTLMLTWDEVQGASQYVVLKNGQVEQTVPAGTTLLLVNGLSSGTNYTFDVYAENASGQGGTQQANGLTIPSQVDGLQATAIGETETTLLWNPVMGADRYRVKVNGKTVEVADTSLNVKGLEGSVTYDYSVEAGNASGYGAMAEASFLTAPYAPSTIQVTETTESSIGLAWDAVHTATSYIVRKDDQMVGTVTEPTIVVTGLDAGQSYEFTVQAVNATGTSTPTSFTWMAKPSAPTGVRVVPNAYNAEVSWDLMTGAETYIVEDGSTVLYRGTDNSSNLTGLSDGTEYSFTVRAENVNQIESENTSFDVLTLPKKPVEIGITEVQTKQLTLDLSKTQVVGAEEYVIDRDGKPIGTIKADQIVYTDTKLTPGTKYTYTVKAKNASGVGESQTFVVTTKTVAVSKDRINVVPETYSLGVTWEAVPGAVAYQIRNTVTDEEYSTSETKATMINLPDGSVSSFEITVANESDIISEGTSFEGLTKPVSPATASVLQVTDVTAELDLSSSAVRGADEFIIVRDGVEIGSIPADQLSFKDEGLKPGTTYTYVVKSANASGLSDTGFTVSLKTLPATVSHSATVTDITSSSVIVTWDAVEGADGYRVMVGDTVYTETDQTSVTIDGLESAKTYDNLKIEPFNDSGDAASFEVTPFDTLPVIAGLSVEAKPETYKVTFDWTFPSKNEVFVVTYNEKEVYRGKDKGFVLEGLLPGLVHDVSFHTENPSGAKSEVVTYAVQTKPEGPKDVGYMSTASSVILSFRTPAVIGAEEYVIEMNGEEVSRVSATAASYEIPNLTPGVAYEFVVKASNGSGISDAGFTFQTTTLPPMMPTPPTAGNGGTTDFDLTWEAVPGATGYKVYIGDDLVLTTTETNAKLSGLESAKIYDNVRVVPFNAAGDGEAIAVPAFETLPSGDFTAEAISQSTSEIEYKWTLASPNEIFVLAKADKEVYRGKDRSFVLGKQPSSTTVDLQIWTENAGGAKSEAQTVSGKTKAAPSSGGEVTPTPTPTPTPTKEPETKPEPPVVKDVHFEDISKTFNRDQISFLAEQGIIAGVSETKFEPQRAITRAEFTALVVRLIGFSPASYEGTFKDVEPNAWYAEYVAVGVANEVIKGMGQGIFAPNQEITREQASVILANVIASNDAQKEEQGTTFADQDRISYWAVDQVEYLASMQMVKGYQDGTFRPLANLNRAEAAALIYRLKELLQ